MSTKVLIVASAVQKAVLEQVLLQEIATGFWKEARPADHADSWKGVSIEVGTQLGAQGFDIPRNYNFVNPDFFKKAEAKLLEAAKTVEPEITAKSLKKHLLELNQILGGRFKEVGGVITKLPRGRKAEETETKTVVKAATTTRKAAAVFTELPPEFAPTTAEVAEKDASISEPSQTAGTETMVATPELEEAAA